MEAAVVTPTGLSALVVMFVFLMLVTAVSLVAQAVMEWRVLKAVRELKTELSGRDARAAASAADPRNLP